MAQVDQAQAALLQVEAGLLQAKSGVIQINADHRCLFENCKDCAELNEDVDKLIKKIDSALRVKRHLHQCYVNNSDENPDVPVVMIGT
jgi:hypothetical protein